MPSSVILAAPPMPRLAAYREDGVPIRPVPYDQGLATIPDLVKEHWARNAVLGRADAVFLRANGRVVGLTPALCATKRQSST